jgi:hypothetical protein
MVATAAGTFYATASAPWTPPARARGSSSAPAAPTPRGGSPSSAPRSSARQTRAACRAAPWAGGRARAADTARWSGCRNPPLGQVAEDLEQLVVSSPRPTITPDLVTPPGRSLLGVAQQFERALVARAGAHHAVEPRHGLVLWFSTSGRASTTIRSPRRLPWKSGISTSTRQPGAWRRISSITSAKARAPPTRSSSRLTLVMTACCSPSWPRPGPRAAARQSRWGSGRPLGTAQKPQRRVHRLPSIMKVAVLWCQHSPMLGQCALSHTVCSFSARQPLQVVVVLAHRRARLQPLRLGRGSLAAPAQSAPVPSRFHCTGACSSTVRAGDS